jgi:hypothetical protein
MATLDWTNTSEDPFVLRFQSLFSPDALAFPCGPNGEVDIDALSEEAKCNYLVARALVGRDFEYPVVVRESTGSPPFR